VVIDDLALDHGTLERQLAGLAAFSRDVSDSLTDQLAQAVASMPSRAPSAPTVPRAGYCGASDIAAIIGVDPVRTPLDVWASATGRVVSVPSTAMEAGNDHEAAVVAGYRRRVTRHGLVLAVEHPGPGTLLSPRDPRRGATPDAIATHARYGPIVAEAKYVGTGGAHAWGPEEAGADGLPEHVLCQVHWQTLTVREAFGWAAPIAHVAADLGTDRRVYEVEIDDSLIAALLEAFASWWHVHVELDEMPMPGERDLETLGRVFSRPDRGLLTDVPAEVELLVAEYDVAREAVKLAEAQRDRVAAQLCAMLGPVEGYRGPWGKASWAPRTRTKVDWYAVAKELAPSAALIERYTTETPSRVLDVRLTGERRR
jgi:predicted phage-related endonuclease